MLTHVSRLYLGGSIPNNGGDISAAAFGGWLARTVPAIFPDGFTAYPAEGGWRDAATGKPIREGAWVVEVAHNNGCQALGNVHAIASSYKEQFYQDAVMVVTAPAVVEFI